MNLKLNTKKGITIVETVIYTAILTIVLTLIVQVMFSIVRTHRVVRLKQSIESSATLSMERMLREIRNATSVDVGGSTFGSSPGRLTLDGTDANGLPYTITFDLSGGTIRISSNGSAPGNLSLPGVTADSLIFRNMNNSISSGVKVELSLSGSTGAESRTLDLFGFAVLRNSY
jgi:type II secretory pathway pseudopilin PulG